MPNASEVAASVAQVARRLPGFILGAPARMVLRAHAPEDAGDGMTVCMRHRRIVEWPCREWLDADASLSVRPEWR